ncbi:MAG: HYR domain-containing protein, partial [Bernardetiaceae bacterium]|nr:HYR domain-containing protein [Bernardetiaceae bacterium]
MKNKLLLLIGLTMMIWLGVGDSLLYAQSTTCADATALCASDGATFPAGTTGGFASTSQPGINYGCLTYTMGPSSGSAGPNPAWYFFEIDESGDIELTLTNSAGVDIDFALWGPFPAGSDISALCASNLGGSAPLDCSFAPAATEVANITGAVSGQVYVLLISNFAGSATDITVSQTNGAGTTDCGIVCLMTGTLSLTGDVLVCPGTTSNYTATIDDADAIVYSLSPADAGIINSTTGEVSWADDFSGSATITATASAINCTDKTTSIVVTSLIISGELEASANPICLGDEVTFTADPDGINPDYVTYEFFVNGVSQGAASATNTFVSATLDDGDVVEVVVDTEPYDVTLTGGGITIPNVGVAAPYPSTVTGAGIDGVITNVQVEFTNFVHARRSDVNVMLMAPDGTMVTLMSGIGGNTDIQGPNTITFSDAAAGPVPAAGNIAAGVYTFQPTADATADNYPAPGPGLVTPAEAPADLSQFNGLSANGAWRLFIVDTSNPRNGSIGSWKIIITVEPNIPCPIDPAPITMEILPPDVTAVCQNVIIQLDADGNATVSALDVDNGSTVGCGTELASLVLSDSVFTCADLGDQTVTLTVSDTDGNTATCDAIITVGDTIAPTIVCPTTQTVSADANCEYTLADYTALATIDDNCPTGLVVTQSPAIGSLQSGVTLVTLTVTDLSGNSTECNFNVEAEDVTAPVAVCQIVTIQLDADGNATLTPAAVNNGSSDNCTADGDLVLSLSKTAFDCSDLGTNTVTLTVMDSSGNSSTCNATITVVDEVDPTITCPGDQDIATDANCEYALPDYTALATVDDNCGTGGLTVTQSPAIGTTHSGTTTVTLTVTDDSGNSADCSFDVLAIDTIAPVAVCQAVTIQLDATGNATLAPTAVNDGSSDNCTADGDLVLSLSQTAFDCSDLGTNTVTLTVTDGVGNSSTCNATITVEDNIAPTITCPADQTVTDDELMDYTGMATADDNCSVSVTQTPAAGTTLIGTTEITLTATDASGNSVDCTFEVTVTSTPTGGGGGGTVPSAEPVGFFTAVAQSPYDILLSWTASPNAERYALYRQKEGTTEWVRVAVLS